MDRTEMIERLEKIAKHAVHTLGEEPFFMSLDDGIAVKAAIEIISAQPTQTNTPNTLKSLDCIDRQTAIDAMAKAMPSLTTPDGCGECDRDIYIADEAFVDCMQIINELPSAQPERIRGRWNKISPAGIYECSVCGQNVMTDDIDVYHYCHGCGAEMGERDE